MLFVTFLFLYIPKGDHVEQCNALDRTLCDKKFYRYEIDLALQETQ